MRIKSLAHGENILMLRFEPATFVSKINILSTTPIVRERETNVPNPVLSPTTVLRRTHEREWETNVLNLVLTPITVVRRTHVRERQTIVFSPVLP